MRSLPGGSNVLVRPCQLSDDALVAREEDLAAIERELDELEREERRRRGRADPAWWLRYYLPSSFPTRYGQHHLDIIADFKAMVDAVATLPASDWTLPDDWWDIDTSAANDDEQYSEAEWEEILGRGEVEGVPRSAAYACPRGHGKSTLFEGLLLWAICEELFRFGFIVSKVLDQSKLRLDKVKTELEDNERIRADYGDLVGTRKWTETDIVTSTGVRLRAYGTLSKIRGVKHGAFRPDLILVDDGEEDEHVRTEPQRQKTRDWFTRALIPTMEPDRGILIVNGTILHYDSLLARLVGDDHFAGWRKRRYRALSTLPDGRLAALWPSKWPVPRLLALKNPKSSKCIGTVAFNCEYQNDPISDETALFQLSWLLACKDKGRPFVESYEDIVRLFGGLAPICVVTGWDYGWVDSKEDAEARDSNYTANIAIAVHPVTRRRYLVTLFRDRGLPPSQIKKRMKTEAAIIRPPAESGVIFRVGVENVGLQKQLYEVGVQQETDLPVVGVTTGKEKADIYRGVPGLSALAEGGQIRFPWPTDDTPDAKRQREVVQALINELYGLGSEAHNDLVMALWFCEILISRILRNMDAKARRAGLRPGVLATITGGSVPPDSEAADGTDDQGSEAERRDGGQAAPNEQGGSGGPDGPAEPRPGRLRPVLTRALLRPVR